MHSESALSIPTHIAYSLVLQAYWSARASNEYVTIVPNHMNNPVHIKWHLMVPFNDLDQDKHILNIVQDNCARKCS